MVGLLTTGELAKRGETTLRTIRYYEAQGLLPSQRSEGGHRYFSEDALIRLQLIKDLRSLEFSLDQIRILLDSWEAARKSETRNLGPRRDALMGVAQQIEQKLRDTEDRLRALRRVHDEFLGAVEILHNCGPCDKAPGGPVCPTCNNLTSRPPSRLIEVLYRIGGNQPAAALRTHSVES